MPVQAKYSLEGELLEGPPYCPERLKTEMKPPRGFGEALSGCASAIGNISPYGAECDKLSLSHILIFY